MYGQFLVAKIPFLISGNCYTYTCLGMPGRAPDSGRKRVRERLPHWEILAGREAVRNRRRDFGDSALAHWPDIEPRVQGLRQEVIQ